MRYAGINKDHIIRKMITYNMIFKKSIYEEILILSYENMHLCGWILDTNISVNNNYPMKNKFVILMLTRAGKCQFSHGFVSYMTSVIRLRENRNVWLNLAVSMSCSVRLTWHIFLVFLTIIRRK